MRVCVRVKLMAAGRLRMHYCRLIVATSAVWFVVDIMLFVYFTDCLLPTEKCVQRQQQSVTSSLSGSKQPRSFFGRLLPGGLLLSFLYRSCTCEFVTAIANTDEPIWDLQAVDFC